MQRHTPHHGRRKRPHPSPHNPRPYAIGTQQCLVTQDDASVSTFLHTYVSTLGPNNAWLPRTTQASPPFSTQPPSLRHWQTKKPFHPCMGRRALIFRGSTQIPRLARMGKGALS